MAKYSALTDVSGEIVLIIEERHLTKADTHVDAALIGRGIPVADITLPQPILTELAVNIALRLAAVEQAAGNEVNSPLLAKAREYQRIIDALLDSLTRESVGLSQPVGTGFASFKLSRG